MATQITSESELRAVLGQPLQRTVDKERERLHPEHAQWLAASSLCFVATSGSDGTCDVSPKGDPAGSLAHLVDDRTLAIAERPGNRRADGFINLISNPQIGLIFLVPGRADTLRINGTARLLTDAPYADSLIVKGHRPLVICEVTVEQVFFHCAKAFIRSATWEPDSWAPTSVPSRAEIAHSLERPEDSLAELEAYYGENYRTQLY